MTGAAVCNSGASLLRVITQKDTLRICYNDGILTAEAAESHIIAVSKTVSIKMTELLKVQLWNVLRYIHLEYIGHCSRFTTEFNL